MRVEPSGRVANLLVNKDHERIFEVYEDDSYVWVGAIVHREGRWLRGGFRVVESWWIYTAGDGIPFDRTARYNTDQDAVAALLEVRARDGRHDRQEGQLSQFERDVLDLAGFRFNEPGARVQAIYELLGINETRYHQLLVELIDRPEALAYNPTVVKRLRARVERGRRGIDRIA